MTARRSNRGGGRKPASPTPAYFIAAANDAAAVAARLMRDAATLTRAAAFLMDGDPKGLSSLHRYADDRKQLCAGDVRTIARVLEQAIERGDPDYARKRQRGREKRQKQREDFDESQRQRELEIRELGYEEWCRRSRAEAAPRLAALRAEEEAKAARPPRRSDDGKVIYLGRVEP